MRSAMEWSKHRAVDSRFLRLTLCHSGGDVNAYGQLAHTQIIPACSDRMSTLTVPPGHAQVVSTKSPRRQLNRLRAMIEPKSPCGRSGDRPIHWHSARNWGKLPVFDDLV